MIGSVISKEIEWALATDKNLHVMKQRHVFISIYQFRYASVTQAIDHIPCMCESLGLFKASHCSKDY